jgi:predicted component of type VI protein secretion system
MTGSEERLGLTSAVSLIDRLRLGLPARRSREAPDEVGRIRAIGASIVLMLNSNSGTSAASPGMGLAWSNGLASQGTEGMRSIMNEVRVAVLAHEPRVSDAKVIYVQPEADHPDHRISLRLTSPFERCPFIADFTFDASGLVRLEHVYFVDR